MPSATFGVPYVNKESLFFCCHGTSASVLWPLGTQLRVRINPNDKVHPEIEQIVRAAIEPWKLGLNEGLSFRWRSAWGAKSLAYSADEKTMNIALGQWKEKLAVYTHAGIARAAAHLFGHALGLPHAKIAWSSAWNKANMDASMGTALADVMIPYVGSLDLKNPSSIMAFDRPGKFGSGVDERRGGGVIDEESLVLLRKLYPPVPTVHAGQLANSQQPGWREGTGHIVASKRFNTAQTQNIITGLTGLDMGIKGNVRINSFTQTIGNGFFDIVQGCWADTHILDASCDVMSFAHGDNRVQTGREEYRNWKPNSPDSQDNPGVTLSRRITFNRNWKKTPKKYSCQHRGTQELVGIDGFTIKVEVWGESLAYNVQMNWLAHEADDWTIRSGVLEGGFFPNRIKSCTASGQFSPPMTRRPQQLFCALTHIDVETACNIRLQYKASWTETGVEAEFLTWERESVFHRMMGCYIAVQ